MASHRGLFPPILGSIIVKYHILTLTMLISKVKHGLNITIGGRSFNGLSPLTSLLVLMGDPLSRLLLSS